MMQTLTLTIVMIKTMMMVMAMIMMTVKAESPVEEILRRVARYKLVAKLKNLQKTTFLYFVILIFCHSYV